MKKSVVSRLNFKKNIKFYIGILIYILAFGIPLVVRSPYWQNVAIISMCSAVLGIGFLIGHRAGLINMTIPTFWGIGAYMSAILVRETGMSTWLALPICVVASGIIALGLGYVLISSGSSGFAFDMLTQVVCMMFPVLVATSSGWEAISGFSVESR